MPGFLIHGNRLRKNRPSQRGASQNRPVGLSSTIPSAVSESGPVTPGGPSETISPMWPCIAAPRKKRGRPCQGPKVKDRKRGAAAWGNLARVAASAHEAGQRMLIHTVADVTALRCYIPALRKFVAYVQEEQLADGSPAAIDEAASFMRNIEAGTTNTLPAQHASGPLPIATSKNRDAWT